MADPYLTAGSVPPADTPGNQVAATRIRRRNRTIASCLECRRRKLKCDKQAPCTNCQRFKRDCLYLASSLDSMSQQRLAEIKDKMGTLEQTLERDVARRKSSHDHEIKLEDEDSDDEEYPEPEDEKGLEPTPLAILDQVYEDDAEDELMDLGVRLGKMRISDRVGGFVRLDLAAELGGIPELRRRSSTNSQSGVPASQPTTMWFAGSPEGFIGPGPGYLPPASNLFFPQTSLGNSLADSLPSRGLCDGLLARYWQSVHPLARTVHRSSFERQYSSFWEHVAMGTEPPASIQAIIFAALFSAAVSMSETQVLQQYVVAKAALVGRLQSSTEMALSRAQFLRTTKLDTMQAFVMYLLPLCREEVTRAHSALTGTAIRLAECMGLHRDGSAYGMSVLETHVRRLVWYQLCFLDLRTSEATGPRPGIRKEDFDTKLPLLRSDAELALLPSPVDDATHWTEMTLTTMRFECHELQRWLWAEIPRIDAKKQTITAALAKVQRFRAHMERKYAPLLKGNSAEQMLAGHIYRVLSNRPFVMVLHRYLTATTVPIPDRLRKVLIDACFATSESSMALDTRPELEVWSWYRGAFFQYHSAMLLLVHVQERPDDPNVARAWRVLDYVFELPDFMSARDKVDNVTTALRNRLLAKQSKQKSRATTQALSKFSKVVNASAASTSPGSSFQPGQFYSAAAPTSDQSPAFGGDMTAPMQYSSSAMSPRGDVQLGPATVSMAPSTSYFSAPVQQHARQHVQQQQQQQDSSLFPAQFSPPPIMSSSEDGSSPVMFNASPKDVHMNAVADIDWNEWDKYFPAASDSSFAQADLVDFDMGSFNPFPAYYGTTQ